MRVDPNFFALALILWVGTVLFSELMGFFKYALSVWALRTSKSPGERKAQAEVASKALSSYKLKDQIKLPALKKGRDPD